MKVTENESGGRFKKYFLEDESITPTSRFSFYSSDKIRVEYFIVPEEEVCLDYLNEID